MNAGVPTATCPESPVVVMPGTAARPKSIGDTTSPAAVVAVRYLLRDAARAFFFDSGAVQVRRERDKISGRADGSGTESGIRTRTHIQYHDVALPPPTDTVPCTFQP